MPLSSALLDDGLSKIPRLIGNEWHQVVAGQR
jgi:hypothetical protein